MKVSSILSTKGSTVITIHPEQTVKDAVTLYDQHNIGALVVVDAENKVVGIISERDVVRQLVRHDEVSSMPVHRVMTRNVVFAMPQDELMSIANTMTDRRFRHLPILENDQLVGMISIGDVLKAQRDQYRGESDTLEVQILAEKTEA